MSVDKNQNFIPLTVFKNKKESEMIIHSCYEKLLALKNILNKEVKVPGQFIRKEKDKFY